MKISLITGTFNSQKTLQDTINSVKIQDYEDIEYIIIDGGSKDETLSIIQNNSQIVSKWISEPDMGIYDAMNKGIKLATGDVVGIINSDDIYPESTIVSGVAHTFKEHDCDALFGDLKIVDRNNISRVMRTWKTKPYEEGGFLKGWHPPHPTFFVKRKIYQELGHFNTDLNISADFELMLRFIQRFQIKTHYMEKTLVHMRSGGESNRSLKNILEGNRNIKRAFELNGFKYPSGYFYRRMIQKLMQFLKK